jgi:hypothetical protein
MNHLAALTLALFLLTPPAVAQHALTLAPGHTLRLHAATPDRPTAVAYTLDLAAGDWLAVTAPAAIVDGSATEPPIVLTGPAGQQTRDFGRLVTRIDAAGPWRLALSAMHSIEIARYPAGHPLVDPGIAPAAIRLTPGTFPAPRFAVEPYDPTYLDAPPPSGTPARLTITLGDDVTIHLYRRAALAQSGLWAHDPTSLVARLLEGTRPLEPGLHLPTYPIGNGYVAYTARPERLHGACLTWLRYIARHTQEEAYPFDPLTYTALGLSPDGIWFAVATATATHAPLPAHSATGGEGRSPEYEAALTRRIAEDPAGLTPGLAALDAVTTSLCPG